MLKFEGICLITCDVPRLARFYADLFETTCEGNDQHATLTIAGLGLSLWREGQTSAAEEAYLRSLRKHSYALIFSSLDVDAAYLRAAALGAIIQEVPADQPWGCRAFVLNDPDGNRIDIISSLENK